MELKPMLDVVVAFAAIGGFCLSLCNCALELVRSRPRGKVRVWKVRREDGVDIGFTATALNTGKVAFTVCELRLYAVGGKRVPATPVHFNKLPKVIHPGEQCCVEVFCSCSQDEPGTGDVVRAAFALATDKELQAKPLADGIDTVPPHVYPS